MPFIIRRQCLWFRFTLAVSVGARFEHSFPSLRLCQRVNAGLNVSDVPESTLWEVIVVFLSESHYPHGENAMALRLLTARAQRFPLIQRTGALLQFMRLVVQRISVRIVLHPYVTPRNRNAGNTDQPIVLTNAWDPLKFRYVTTTVLLTSQLSRR